MNIYLVSRTDICDYDQYDSFVVVCNDEDEARKTRPDGTKEWPEKYQNWVN